VNLCVRATMFAAHTWGQPIDPGCRAIRLLSIFLRLEVSSQLARYLAVMRPGLMSAPVHKQAAQRQIVTDTTNQARVASSKISEDERPGKSCHTMAAKAIMPRLPIAAPTASTPPTFLPRIAPCSPTRCFLSVRSPSRWRLPGKLQGRRGRVR
jgi:hypothetical protein